MQPKAEERSKLVWSHHMLNMEPLLSGGDLARIRSHEFDELTRRGEDVQDARVSLGEGIAMKGQTSAFCKVKLLMPSLMTRSVPWSYRYKRELLPLEALEVMGVPIFDEHLPQTLIGLQSIGCPYKHLLDSSLGDVEVRRLAGNGMSLQVMGVAFLCGLSSVHLNEHAEQAMPEDGSGASAAGSA